MHTLLPIHVAAGGLAILLGAVALIVKKGGMLHRRSGMLFVYAMLVMGTTASILEFLKTPKLANVVAALMSIYFVGTALTTVRPASRWTRLINVAALTTVRPPSRWTRLINAAALTVALGLAFVSLLGGLELANKPGLSSGGVPFRTIGRMSFILATVLTLSAIGDVRVMISGLSPGGRRLARHLWRMCFALFIAAGSFFSIRERVAKILPESLTSGWMRALPILLLFATMFYWLWRVRRRPVFRQP